MNAEEPILSAAPNESVSTTGTPLPEQTTQAVACVPRGISMLNLIHQWQPMGIRIAIDLPFVGDDGSVMFLIRNGPLIPRWDKSYRDSPSYADLVQEDSEVTEATPPDDLRQYAWNNMRNVWLGKVFDKADYGKSGVKITQYDYPPLLATLAQCFRKWRGDLQYRFRVVSGFTTPGYIIVAPVKNVFSPIACYDEYRNHPAIIRQDASYREMMMNSYVMGDTSMYRHVEVTVPYEYPVPYYDQYAWMARRVSAKSALSCGTKEKTDKSSFISTSEPHGDNWVAYMLRGEIGNSQVGQQIFIELEYRACEGFQFADPGLPPYGFTTPYAINIFGTKPQFLVKTIPSGDWTSDGYNTIEKEEEKN